MATGRAARRSIGRHLAQASRRAKTVKLADLIDNCKDITRHDPRFAQVYLDEMDELLDVLSDGDPHLFKRAERIHEKSMSMLGHVKPDRILTMSPESHAEQWSRGDRTQVQTHVHGGVHRP